MYKTNLVGIIKDLSIQIGIAAGDKIDLLMIISAANIWRASLDAGHQPHLIVGLIFRRAAGRKRRHGAFYQRARFAEGQGGYHWLLSRGPTKATRIYPAIPPVCGTHIVGISSWACGPRSLPYRGAFLRRRHAPPRARGAPHLVVIFLRP